MEEAVQELVRMITKDILDKRIASIRRYPTGLSHFVFEVISEDDIPFVLRIARPERRREFEEGIYWQKRLEDLGLPLPKIYHSGEMRHHLFAVYERLSGSDLELVYPHLTAQEKQSIAHEVANIQQRVQSMDERHFKQTYPWVEVLTEITRRSEREMFMSGIGKRCYIDQVLRKIEEYSEYFANLKPVPFLYDLNVRNVLVNSGGVTGVIDVDALWLGDPLLAIGRGKTVLRTMRQDLDFIDSWCRLWNLTELELKMVDFYDLLYCVRFMSTLGQSLNGNYSVQTDPGILGLLENLADEMIS